MSSSTRVRPAIFRALGHAEPPAAVEVAGAEYHLVTVFKHDSWAATARYRRSSHEIVCKFNRTQSIVGLPMRWLGNCLARREARALHRLDDVPGIPRGCGPVSADGRVLGNVVAHDYIEGHPLALTERVHSDFFPTLQRLLQAVHRRGIAYVDLHKRENILVGHDGGPWLIDFQVCYGHWHPHQAKSRSQQLAMRNLQALDFYHLTKHVLRHRPEQVASLGLTEHQQPPGWIRGHRAVAVPLRQLRRSLLARLNIRKKGGRSETEVFPEEAIRIERENDRRAA